MIGATSPGMDANYNPEDVTIKSRNLIILWNLHKLAIQMGKEIGVDPDEIKEEDLEISVEERYMLSKLHTTIKTATDTMDNYRINEMPQLGEDLFLELSRFYIQTTRDKAAMGTDKQKRTVFYTLYHVLLDTLKMFGIVCPFIVDKIYLNMKEAFPGSLKEESIHL